MPIVVLGVTASIAAYKAADLASRMIKAGYDVYPVMTQAAAQLLGPATLEALTGHRCPIGVFDEPYPGEISHIRLATIADAIVIAPATMDVMARIAAGQVDDMLTAIAAASKAPVLVAPGMNTVMWESPANQRNVATLKSFGYHFVDPISGRLACRTVGVGKMAEPATIAEAAAALLARRTDAAGKRILITAGPTREPIDAVRYISNRSSGKMGYALAEASSSRGADVTLVSGPVALSAPANVQLVPVVTASQMCDEALARCAGADIVIAAAAVADYTPETPRDGKIKKNGSSLEVTLRPTTDILAEMGRRKRGQTLVGFAAETDDLIENARQKLEAKNLDWIVANDVTREGAGFDSDTNIVTVIGRSGVQTDLPLLSKREVADRILDLVLGAGEPAAAQTR